MQHKHREIQDLANGNVGASALQQAQPMALRKHAKEQGHALLHEEQDMCMHMPDGASCKDEDADEASGRLLNRDVFKLSELAELTQSTLIGDPEYIIRGVDALDSACSEDASFLANPKYRSLLKETKAGVICIDRQTPPEEGKKFPRFR